MCPWWTFVWLASTALQPQEPAQYETIVPTKAAPATASERDIDSDVIDTANKRSAQDLLRLVPGLLVTQHGAEGKGYQIFLRGFDAAHGGDIEILVNGIPINEMSNVHGQGYIDLGFVIPEVVLAMQVQKGPLALEQGNFAMAGSVGFELGVDSTRRGARASYEIGIQNRHRLLTVVAPKSTSSDTFFAAEALSDQSFGTNRKTQRLNTLSQVGLWHSQDQTQRLRLLLGAYAARFGEPGVLPLADVQRGTRGYFGSYNPSAQGVSQRALLALNYTSRALLPGTLDAILFGQARQLSLDENFTGQLLYPEQGDRKRQHDARVSVGLRLSYQQKLASQLKLVVGAHAQNEWLSQRENQVNQQGIEWQQSRRLDGWQAALGVRAGLVWRPWTSLRVDGGARLDGFLFDVRDPLTQLEHNESFAGVVSPRANLMWTLTPIIQLFASVGRGLRAPEIYRGGKQRVTPANAAELGVLTTPLPSISANVSAFGTWVKNESVFDHTSGTTLEVNATRRLGVEMGVAYRPLAWLQAYVDATWVTARFVDSGAPVPGAPTFLTTAVLSAYHPSGFSLGAQWIFLAPRPLAHGATASTVTTLGLNASYRTRHIEIGVQADNITDARWKEGEFQYASWFDPTQPSSNLPRLHYSPGTPFNLRAALTLWL